MGGARQARSGQHHRARAVPGARWLVPMVEALLYAARVMPAFRPQAAEDYFPSFTGSICRVSYVYPPEDFTWPQFRKPAGSPAGATALECEFHRKLSRNLA